MTRLAATLLAMAVLSACTSTATPSPVPGVLIDGLSVVCDSGPVWPLAPTCSAATAAALHASGYAASEIDFAEFHYGSYCPPGAPCASSVPNSGYVVIHAKKPTPVLIALTADGSGKVTVAGALR